MSVSRREFVVQSSLATAAVALGGPGRILDVARQGRSNADPSLRQLCMLALDAARSAGASYADIRVARSRTRLVRVPTAESVPQEDTDSVGIGVRALVGGRWGFAAGPTVTREEAVRLARAAAADALGQAALPGVDVVLAPENGYPDGVWRSPIEVDPFAVARDEQAALLAAANQEALKVAGVHTVTSGIDCLRVETTFASTLGSLIVQVVHRTYPWLTVTARSPDGLSQTRSSSEVYPAGLGYEHVQAADLAGHAGAIAELAVQKLSAPPVERGSYDLVLMPSHLSLVLSETVGRATALDRALEGLPTTFLAPPASILGTFRLGPEIMNVQGDRTQRGGLATVGWDDEGVPAESWPLVADGVVVDYQTTRALAPVIAPLTGHRRSHACAVAGSWDRMPQLALPNVALLPGEEDRDADALIAATDRGILIRGRGPHRVSPPFGDFRFSGAACYEIRQGRVGRLLRDVAYEGRTAEFWGALDALGGARSYELCGIWSGLGAGSEQGLALSVGCPAARVRGLAVSDAGA